MPKDFQINRESYKKFKHLSEDKLNLYFSKASNLSNQDKWGLVYSALKRGVYSGGDELAIKALGFAKKENLIEYENGSRDFLNKEVYETMKNRGNELFSEDFYKAFKNDVGHSKDIQKLFHKYVEFKKKEGMKDAKSFVKEHGLNHPNEEYQKNLIFDFHKYSKGLEESESAGQKAFMEGYMAVRARNISGVVAKTGNLNELKKVKEVYDAIGVNPNSFYRDTKKAIKIAEEKGVSDYKISETEKLLSGKRTSLEGKIISGIFGALFLAGIFFLSPNLTGNVIANITKSSSNILGVGLFLLGIVGFFVYRKLK